jgi:hypothetical protein
MGLSDQANAEEKTIQSIKMLNFNKPKIYSYIEKNCSKLLYLHPEYYNFPHVNICYNKDGSMTFAKFSILLPTLYNSYLPYALFCPPLQCF